MGVLKDRLIRRERDLSSGAYPKQRLRDADPIRYEILFTRLVGIVQNARETARLISASPVVREMGECVFSLFTPEGDSVCFSNGLLLHVASIGGAVKWMIHNDYEERVGIQEGDYFINNDPHIGGAHSPDQATVTPILYDGQVVGWAGGLIHVLETGATEPGGVCPSGISRYDEGIFWPCVKIAVREELRHDLENIVMRGTRVPLYWMLDTRATMAGDRLIREGIVGLIDEFGLKFYLEAVYEYIEDSRRAAQKTIERHLFPGRYRQIGFIDVPNENLPIRLARNYNIRISCDTTVTTDGQIAVDFEGTSPPGFHPNNASLPCLTGNIIACLIQYLLYDLKPNQGLFQAFRLSVPPSVINPPLQHAVSIWSTGLMATIVNTMNVARAYFSAGFREEVTAGFFAGSAMLTGGLDQYGRPFGAANFEAACAGTGAMGVEDGQHTCYAAFNSEGDFSDVEVWEKVIPQMWLGRRIRIDSGGCGKYQGGGGIETLYFHEHSDHTEMGAVTSLQKVFSVYGMMGGYPAPCNYHYFVSRTNLRECIDRQEPLPHSGGSDPTKPEWLELIRGETSILPGQPPSRPVQRYDLWQNFTMGGGGFGDPLERDPERVRRDLQRDLLSEQVVKSVYGVVINPVTLEVNAEETARCREEIREQRKRRGIPTRKYLAKERARILAGDLPRMAVSCLNECLGNSVAFQEEFRSFWELPADMKSILVRPT